MKIIPFSVCICFALLGSVACGSKSNGGGGGSGITAAAGGPAGTAAGGTSSGDPFPTGTAGVPSLNTDSGGSSGASMGQAACAPGNTTTISGVVYDPAGKNPLYNISVFVADPTSPLPDLDTVPLACGCAQLLPAKVLAIGAPTDATGHFQIPCAPSGSVSLVVQTGKWRRRFDNITVVPNQDNVIPNLRLPANSAEGSLPNIAISTGGSDSFECLPLRIGVSASEYVAGSATGGHIHIYTGLRGAKPATGAVESNQTLWDQQAHLNEHDVVILSCEGQETTGGTTGMRVGATAQQYLMNYTDAGGRVFASHFQYAWFNTGPFSMGANSVATWSTGQQLVDDAQSFPSEVNTTLTGGAAFPEGSALLQWLGTVNALTNNQLPVWFARNNVKALTQPPSTEWLHLAATAAKAPSSTQYFSVDTPVSAAADAKCGRIVYSDLHVSGGPGTNAPGVPPDYPPATTTAATGTGGASGTGTGTGTAGGFGAGFAGGGFGGPGTGFGGGGLASGGTVPSGCATHPLTPQEEALEFMFFDLSSCLVPIGENPPVVPK